MGIQFGEIYSSRIRLDHFW